jgi:predicted DNA binding CopG/RHH family protein
MKQLKNKKEIKSRIPEFTNYEEEAKWWESHNIADYQDEFKTVKVRFGKNLSAGINIRLDPSTLTKLRKEASQKGIGPTTLVRMLIIDHFHQQI